MTDINKHNFLTELSKLLTFMYEEDRLTALSMYEDMFNSCPDEQQLIHHLVSPTRQAVVLARAYDSKERMLDVNTRSKRRDIYEEVEQVPGFIAVLDKISAEAERLFGVKDSVSEDQISLFAQEHSLPESAAIPPVSEIISEETQQENAVVTELSAEDDLKDAQLVQTEVLEAAPSYLPDPSFDAAPDEVDSFLADYDAGTEEEAQLEPYTAPQTAATVRTVRRERSIPLLILYYIFAIPVCLVGVVLLLVPTVICLLLAFVFAAAGIAAISCAIGSFVIFADILVVLGTGLVLAAVGFLFLWLFVWFIGGAIAGLIDGAIKLGNRLCTKEVYE